MEQMCEVSKGLFVKSLRLFLFGKNISQLFPVTIDKRLPTSQTLRLFLSSREERIRGNIVTANGRLRYGLQLMAHLLLSLASLIEVTTRREEINGLVTVSLAGHHSSWPTCPWPTVVQETYN